MTDAVTIALIVAIAPTVLAVAALVAAVGNFMSIFKLRKDVDGRMSQLLATTEAKAKLEGKEEGRVKEHDRQAKKPGHEPPWAGGG